jgi:hypothetical protein
LNDWVKLPTENAIKTTVNKLGSYSVEVATNVSDLEKYRGVKIIFKTTCAKPECTQSLFVNWLTYLPVSNDPLRGSAGIGIDSCSKDASGWQTCTIIPTQNTANPVNKDKFIGHLFHLSFTFFLNDSVPTDFYLKEISLIK